MMSLVISPWIFGGILAALPLIGWSEYKAEPRLGGQCSVHFSSRDPSSKSYLNFVVFLTGLVFPVLVVLHTWYGKRRRNNNNNNNNKSLRIADGEINESEAEDDEKDEKKEKKYQPVVHLMILLYLLTSIPHTLFIVFSDGHTLTSRVGNILTFVSMSSASYHPLLYMATMRRFRKTLLDILLLRGVHSKSREVLAGQGGHDLSVCARVGDTGTDRRCNFTNCSFYRLHLL